MIFYRTKKEYDNYYINGSFLIENELLTDKERIKKNLPFFPFDIVNISKKKTYFIFGVRKQYK